MSRSPVLSILTWILGPLLLFVVLFAIYEARLFQDEPNKPSLSPVNQRIQLPNFNVLTNSGGSKSISAEGNVLLITFWASWCQPCLKELPDFSQLQKDYFDRGFRVIAINAEEPNQSLNFRNSFWPKFEIIFETFYNKESSEALKIKALPTNILVDRKNRIVWRGYGAFNWLDNDVKNIIEKLLEE